MVERASAQLCPVSPSPCKKITAAVSRSAPDTVAASVSRGTDMVLPHIHCRLHGWGLHSLGLPRPLGRVSSFSRTGTHSSPSAAPAGTSARVPGTQPSRCRKWPGQRYGTRKWASATRQTRAAMLGAAEALGWPAGAAPRVGGCRVPPPAVRRRGGRPLTLA